MVEPASHHEVTAFKTFEKVSSHFPSDWLLPLEIAELFAINNKEAELEKVLTYLENMKVNRPEVAKLISNGVDLFLQKAIN